MLHNVALEILWWKWIETQLWESWVSFLMSHISTWQHKPA